MSSPSPTAASAAAGTSMPARAPTRASSRTRPSSSIEPAAGIRPTRNTLRQPSESTSRPPATGPNRLDTLVQAVHEPIAFACAGPEKTAMISPSEPGTSSAPATPCSSRTTISTPAVGARAHSTLVATNATSAIRSTLSRPNASDTAPDSRMNADRVRR